MRDPKRPTHRRRLTAAGLIWDGAARVFTVTVTTQNAGATAFGSLIDGRGSTDPVVDVLYSGVDSSFTETFEGGLDFGSGVYWSPDGAKPGALFVAFAPLHDDAGTPDET